jgi:hypothetical protein
MVDFEHLLSQNPPFLVEPFSLKLVVAFELFKISFLNAILR